MAHALLRIVAATLAPCWVGCVSDTLPAVCIENGSEAGVSGSPEDGGKARADAGRGVDAGRRDAGTDVVDERDGGDPEKPERDAQDTPPVDPGEAGACAPGFTTVADKCTCDLNGTFALYGRMQLTIAGQTGLEDASDTSELWAIAVAQQGSDGNLAFAVTNCGQAVPDLCGTGSALLVQPEAYGQYTTAKTWRKGAGANAASFELSLPEALPEARFVSPEFALLNGIALEDPLGEWPSTRKDVEGGSDFDGSGVNGARWIDDDDDDALGTTTLIVPPGGVDADGSATTPSQSFDATSPKCPRSDAQAQRSPYAYMPLLDGLSIRRVKRLHHGSRVTATLEGRLDSCDRISGALNGPDDGAVRVDTRIGGCAIANGDGESACGASLLDLTEMRNGVGQGTIAPGGTFVLLRVADDVTCERVREQNFD